MRKGTFTITFVDSRVEEIQADEIGHVHDGTLSWLNFHDTAGEVLRVRSDTVERVQRIG